MNNNYQNGGGYEGRGNYQNNNGSEQKIYLGNAKQKQRKQGDYFITGTICIDDLEAQTTQAHIFSGKNGKRYLKIVINPFRDGANQYGNTHSISVDTFRPDPNIAQNGNGNYRGNNNFDQFGNYGQSDPFNRE